MARSEIDVAAPPEAVWAVPAEAGAYGEWVVGTQKVTRADAAWPEVGSALEYRLGLDPVSIGDRTTVVEAAPPRLLVLRAEARRLGAVTIRVELEPADGQTRVVLERSRSRACSTRSTIGSATPR
jgi:uncharacterized protein YndB with AHSA1/START domain